MDGFETAELIRQREASANTPIIFVTAHVKDADVFRGYSLRAVDFLLSPVHPEVLKAKVDIFVELSRRIAENRLQADQLREAEIHLRGALFAEKERAQVTLNSIADAVLSTDVSGNVTYLNRVAERMTGWSSAEAVGRPLADVFRIVDGPTHEAARYPLELAGDHTRALSRSVDCILVRRDGFESPIEDSAAPIHDSSGQVIGAVTVFRDVSVARAMSLQLSRLAQYDLLTSLPNRTLFNDRLGHAIAMAHRQGAHLALLFVDLDGFKHVNDSFGHAIGDALLQSVAHRLLACVRSSDTVSRHGGDEFLDAALTAEKLIAALAAPLRVGDHDLQVTASIGISVYPGDGQEAETLIKAADAAMYHAKEHGRRSYQFFRIDIDGPSAERQSRERGLRGAVERQELVLHYQPKMNGD
jgi:diguanylate cyclase (GGDEF)-like protein/PAS domain S-box-containing protein